MTKKTKAIESVEEVQIDAVEAVQDEAPEAEAVEETAKPAPKPKDTVGLIKMHKHGEALHVHPTTVESHKAAGWNLA